MTQEKLAKMLDVDPSTLATWERNDGRPSRKNLPPPRTVITVVVENSEKRAKAF